MVSTQTTHPIKLIIASDKHATPNIEISGTGTRSVVVNTPLVVNDLTVNGFISAKPYISFRVSTTGGVPSTVSGSTVTIGTPGTVAITNFGFNTSVVCTRGTSGNVNAFLYTFTWTGAHPLGANFGANVLYYTTSTSSAQPLGVITTVVAATSITVWLRATVGTVSNVLQDGSFYV